MVENRRIGFVGLGNMGRPMAENLTRAGYAVVAYDVDTTVLQSFATTSTAEAVASPHQLGDVDILILMLPNGTIVREFLLEKMGG
ncbi:NAD(P)-binding domain-containing protein [Ensifer sp. ENS05]|nr:NAD(P)-binding domain-containing protein [Ensifer sp. ENS05]